MEKLSLEICKIPENSRWEFSNGLTGIPDALQPTNGR